MNFIYIFILLSFPHIILNFYSIYNNNLEYNLEHYQRALYRLETDICTNSELRVLTDADSFCIEAHAITITNPYIKTLLDTSNECINSVLPTNYFDRDMYIRFIFKLLISIGLSLYFKIEKTLPLYHESVDQKTKYF